jgi:hypothetical protein
MKGFVSIDLVVIVWNILFHRLGYCHMKCSVAIPLILSPPYLLCISSFAGMSNATHMLDEDADVGTTDEIAVGSQLSRPTPKRGSSIEVGVISSEVADFFREFDKRTPNPHPEWYFWKFEGSLVSFGDFWVSSDSVPYL